MSLEYAIEYPCEMRRRYDEATLRALGRTGSLISRIVADAVEGARTPSEESVQFATRLALDVERAEEVSIFCRENCLNDIRSDLCLSRESARNGAPVEPIACLGRITYPIEARFERFLADRLQLICDTESSENWPQLLHVLLDSESPFDGEATKELRRVTTAEGLRFFELRVPIQLARSASRLSTDNVFDLLAGFATTDDGASGYHRELPPQALIAYSEFLEGLLLKDLGEAERDRLESTGVTYAQYVRFTCAIRTAESLGVRLLLD